MCGSCLSGPSGAHIQIIFKLFSIFTEVFPFESPYVTRGGIEFLSLYCRVDFGTLFFTMTTAPEACTSIGWAIPYTLRDLKSLTSLCGRLRV
jgi:hypothetical protein